MAEDVSAEEQNGMVRLKAFWQRGRRSAGRAAHCGGVLLRVLRAQDGEPGAPPHLEEGRHHQRNDDEQHHHVPGTE